MGPGSFASKSAYRFWVSIGFAVDFATAPLLPLQPLPRSRSTDTPLSWYFVALDGAPRTSSNPCHPGPSGCGPGSSKSAQSFPGRNASHQRPLVTAGVQAAVVPASAPALPSPALPALPPVPPVPPLTVPPLAVPPLAVPPLAVPPVPAPPLALASLPAFESPAVRSESPQPVSTNPSVPRIARTSRSLPRRGRRVTSSPCNGKQAEHCPGL